MPISGGRLGLLHFIGESGTSSNHLAVLNKIDGLWDALKNPAEIDAEIARQAEGAAHTLAIDRSRVFPVSAQKGLVAKVTHDDALLARSRLPALEGALVERRQRLCLQLRTHARCERQQLLLREAALDSGRRC